MYTLDTKKYSKIALIYLCISIFLALFGAVYEHYSFGVYSYFMLYAFGFSLVGGAFPATILALWGNGRQPWVWTAWLYRSGIATLSVGSIIRGVLAIYGTGNVLTDCYWYVGGGLCVLGGALYIFSLVRNCNQTVSEL